MAKHSDMTRKHFEIVARAIATADSGTFASNLAHARFADHFANHLEETNPAFDREKFILASMPRWMVGTRYANVWERLSRR